MEPGTQPVFAPPRLSVLAKAWAYLYAHKTILCIVGFCVKRCAAWLGEAGVFRGDLSPDAASGSRRLDLGPSPEKGGIGAAVQPSARWVGGQPRGMGWRGARGAPDGKGLASPLKSEPWGKASPYQEDLGCGGNPHGVGPFVVAMRRGRSSGREGAHLYPGATNRKTCLGATRRSGRCERRWRRGSWLCPLRGRLRT